MAKRDYYDVLGVEKGTSRDDIKKAYRRLAKKYHPDMNRDDPKGAEERFKELSEAYEVLADDDKRKLYDQYGHAGLDSQFGAGGFKWSDFTHFSDIEDMFDRDLFRDFFGNGMFESLFGGRGPRGRRASRGRDLRVDIEIGLDEVLKGTKKELRIPHRVKCEACGGTGAEPGGSETCQTCRGAGQVQSVQERGMSRFIRITTCQQCGGAGTRITKPCKTCRTRGTLERVSNLEGSIPRGAFDGLRLRVEGKGEVEKGLEPGDLYIVVHLREHELFKVDGSDLYMEMPITFPLAAMGGEVEVPTLEGKVKMNVPAGTQSHETFRLRGKGLPELDSGYRGDQLVVVIVVVPQKLTPEQKEALKAFERLAGDYRKQGKSRWKWF